MRAYRLVRSLLSGVLRAFYQQIRVVGLENVPPEGAGPVIFAGNHPNSLLDPALIVCTCDRYVHFAAKDVLFRSPPLRVILSAMGAVPIYRRKDHPDGKLDNSSTFQALHQVLADGRSMGIFPEGISHDDSQLAGMKTGAARIGLGLQAEAPALPLVVIPCGLTYVRRKRWRSRVLVQYGDPIPVAEHLELHREDPRAASRALTDRIEAGLRALTVNAEDWDTVRVLDGVRRLYQPPRIPLEHRVELSRRFNEVYPAVREHPEVVVLYARVRRYVDRLDALGLEDRDISDVANLRSKRIRALHNLLLVLFWLPLALPGFIVFAPVAQLVAWAGVNFAPRKDVIATTKLVLGVGALGAVYAGLILALGWFTSWWTAILAAALLPLSAIAALKVLARGTTLAGLVEVGLKSFFLSREIDDLRRQRRMLEAEVVRAVGELIPDDMEPLYPREVTQETAEETVD